jgi:D-glycerate 3-kinase
MNPIATIIADNVLGWIEASQPLIVGVCGTQASGKSTACEQVAAFLTAQGLTVGVLGLDDLYLGRKARAELALKVHPLFATRGPPGTHDVMLGIAVLDAVRRGEAVQLPRFDKRADEPLPRDAWPELSANCDVLLFEGWCVGAQPQQDEALIEPVNALEREEDRDGVWRRTFNGHLIRATGDLFTRIDRLIYLRPPGFEIVHTWRCEQEHVYLKTDRAEGAPAAMSDDQVTRFIAHYERITRHIMAEMPKRADLTLQLDSLRCPVAVMAQG